MNREKRTGEVEVHTRAHFSIQCMAGIEFLICTAGFMCFNLWVWLTCNGLGLPPFENQPPFLYWSMIRRTGHEFLLQLERGACIAITILVRLQQVNRTLID
jgi:hypothetical protein